MAKMTKAAAIEMATARGLAVYRGDTIGKIIERINADIRMQAEAAAEKAARAKAAKSRRFATMSRVHRCAPRAVQLGLPLNAPRDWSGVRGIAA